MIGNGIYLRASVGIMDDTSLSLTWDGSKIVKIKLDCTGIAKAEEVVVTPDCFKTSFRASTVFSTGRLVTRPISISA